MTALHAIDEFIVDDKDDEEEEDFSVCQSCGSARFVRRVYGNYTETHYVNTDNWHEEWDNMDTDQQDADTWECQDCGATATDEVEEYIQDHV